MELFFKLSPANRPECALRKNKSRTDVGGLAFFIKALWLPANSEVCKLEGLGFGAGVQFPLPAASVGCKWWPSPLPTPCTAVGGGRTMSARCQARTPGRCRPWEGKAEVRLHERIGGSPLATSLPGGRLAGRGGSPPV